MLITMTSYGSYHSNKFFSFRGAVNFVRVEVIERGYVPCIAWSWSILPNGEEEAIRRLAGSSPTEYRRVFAYRNGIDFVFVLTPELRPLFDRKVLGYRRRSRMLFKRSSIGREGAIHLIDEPK